LFATNVAVGNCNIKSLKTLLANSLTENVIAIAPVTEIQGSLPVYSMGFVDGNNFCAALMLNSGKVRAAKFVILLSTYQWLKAIRMELNPFDKKTTLSFYSLVNICFISIKNCIIEGAQSLLLQIEIILLLKLLT